MTAITPVLRRSGPAAGDVIIQTSDLTKRYGEQDDPDAVLAVDRLNLKVRRGEVFGLLGPNGAGKTTTILMLLGLTEPSYGTAWVGGINPTRDPLRVKSQVGYVPDNVGFYEDLTARANLRYTAAAQPRAGQGGRRAHRPPARGRRAERRRRPRRRRATRAACASASDWPTRW